MKIHRENPSSRRIQTVVEALESGHVIAYPTDSVYAIGVHPLRKKAVERLCRIRKLDPAQANLTLICASISQMAQFTYQIDNHIYQYIRENTPGPVTFILRASKKVSHYFKNKKKTVGIRIPDHGIAQAIVEELQYPLLSASLKKEDDENGYYLDSESVFHDFNKMIDLVIDSGTVGDTPSMVVDCTGQEIEILREGPAG